MPSGQYQCQPDAQCPMHFWFAAPNQVCAHAVFLKCTRARWSPAPVGWGAEVQPDAVYWRLQVVDVDTTVPLNLAKCMNFYLATANTFLHFRFAPPQCTQTVQQRLNSDQIYHPFHCDPVLTPLVRSANTDFTGDTGCADQWPRKLCHGRAVNQQIVRFSVLHWKYFGSICPHLFFLHTNL